MARKDRVVAGLVKGVHSLLAGNDVELLAGSGMLIDEHTVKVSQKDSEILVKASHIIIASGSEPAVLPIPEPWDFVIDSTQALELSELPDSLVIIGGGVIGMEFAFIFARLGVKVTLIEYLEEILALIDSDLTQVVVRNLRMAGVKLHTNAKVISLEKATMAGLWCILRMPQPVSRLPVLPRIRY